MDVTTTLKMHCLDCANCGILFGITQDFEARRREDHRDFYCPSGHANRYNQKSEADRLRDKLRAEGLEKERAMRDAAEAKAANEALLKRVHAGVCPCCKRTFKQLAAHMARKHPEVVS
jgi:hypothetical protein